MDINNEYGCRDEQIELLSMMKDIHEFMCRQKISYSLGGGSLLGAIRHSGFIPWDDDMDLVVDRQNQEKLLRSFSECRGYVIERHLWVYSIRREYRDEKADSLKIDVFVLDHSPECAPIRRLKTGAIRMLQGMLKGKPRYSRYSAKNRVLLFVTYNIGKLLPRKCKLQLYDAVSKIGNKKETRYVTAYDSLFQYLDNRYDAQTMKRLELHPFEDSEFFITSLYDSHLTTLYGDYMTPPPEKERRKAHM